MAATIEAARLTEAHRLAQARLGARVVQQIITSWRLLDVADLDATIGPWLRIVIPLIQGQRATSATLASNYLTTFRSLEFGMTGRFVPLLAPTASVEQLATSLTVTGPFRLRSALANGVPQTQAVETAQASSARSAMRHALNGGRATIADTVDNDRSALGWARATSGSPCAFCAMLASRGAVYRSETTARFRAHDACACQPEPIYRRDAALPAGADRFGEIWASSTKGLSGSDALNAFRKALNA